MKYLILILLLQGCTMGNLRPLPKVIVGMTAEQVIGRWGHASSSYVRGARETMNYDMSYRCYARGSNIYSSSYTLHFKNNVLQDIATHERFC